MHPYLEVLQSLDGGEKKTPLVIAVSKKQSLETIKEVYDLGARDFGESRVQELLEKMDLLPQDIRWHFIGPLQKNKVAKLVGKGVVIHSLDSYSLAETLEKRGNKLQSITEAFIQFNPAKEEQKQGFFIEEAKEVFTKLSSYQYVHFLGLMMMAPKEADESALRECFLKLIELKELFLSCMEKKTCFFSMGMSQDYLLATECGATHIRLGRRIFSKD